MRPEAGWYPDPSDATQLRWWDGRAWTEERTSADGAVPVYRDPVDEPAVVDLSKQAPAPAREEAPSPVTPAQPVPVALPAGAQSHAGYQGVAMTASGLPLAGQGMRLLARMIDWLLLGVTQFALTGPWRGGYQAALEQYNRTVEDGAPDPFAFLTDPGYTRYMLASAVIGLVLTGMYEVMLLRYRGATLGKTLCRIKVVSRDGGRIGWWQAVGRWFTVYPLAQLTCYLFRLMDGAWCLFDADRDCLHDKMASTQVVVSQR